MTRTGLSLFVSMTCLAAVVHAQDAADSDVIIGIIDQGIDWWHPDLLETGTSSSRILFLWDQRTTDRSRRPREGFGTEWTRDDLNQALKGHLDIDHRDDTGETTVGALVAAGNGTASRNEPGFAPHASLIVVSPRPTIRGVLSAARYIERKVDELERESGPKKLVMSISQGSHFSTHHRPGQLNDYFDAIAGPDRIIVASAGNARGSDIHASRVLTRNQGRFEFPLDIPDDVAKASQIWVLSIYPEDADVTCGVSIDGTEFLVPKGGDDEIPTRYGTVRMHNAARSRLSTTLENEFVLLIENERGESPALGTWALVFEPIRVTRPGAVDSWVAWPKPKPNVQNVRFLAHVDDTELVEWPASAVGVIGVGATDGNSGGLYRYSSPGWWTSAARPKPDISAPGVKVERLLESRDGRSEWPVTTSGTSLAAPYVAGCIARLLDASPVPLTPDSVLVILCNSVVRDHGSSSRPDIFLGCGCLDPNRIPIHP